MKKFFVLAFLLCACTPGTLTPGSLAQAQANLNGQIAATSTAMLVENRQATATAWAQSSEATRIHNAQLADQATATQRAAIATATAIATAEYMSGEATRVHWVLQVDDWLDQQHLHGTQAAIAEQNVNRYSDLQFNFWCGAAVLAGAIAIMLTLFAGSRLVPPTIKALGENRSRIIVAEGIGHSLRANGHQAVVASMPTSAGGVPDFEVKLARNRETVIADPEPTDSLNDDNRSVWRGLKNMADLVGGHSVQIPSSSERVAHGLYNEVYQPIINALKQSNDIRTVDGKPGLWINVLKWNDIDALMGAIVGNLADYTGRVQWNGNKRPT